MRTLRRAIARDRSSFTADAKSRATSARRPDPYGAATHCDCTRSPCRPAPLAVHPSLAASAGELRDEFAELERSSAPARLAVAISDFETGAEFDFNGDRWFHAASTIKLAVSWASSARSIAASCCSSRGSTYATAS